MISNGKLRKLKRHGERIRYLREAENITQEKLSEMLGISKDTLKRAENGEKFLSGEAAVKIYLEFGYSTDWLYGISDVDKLGFDTYVSVRDVFRYQDSEIVITIKEKYLKDIIRTEEIIHDSEIADNMMDEDYPRFLNGIKRQRRNFIYFGDDSTYYQASVDLESFEKVL